jgi:exocyst complex protein 7
MLGETFSARYEKLLRKNRDSFQDYFRPMLEPLMDTSAAKKDMSSSDRANVKERFSKFNGSIEDGLKGLRICAVPDPELKQMLIKDARSFVVPMYERFVSRYRNF